MGQTCSCMSSRSGLKPQFDSIPEPAEDQADQPPGLMSASRAHQSDIGDGKAAFAAGFVHERSIKMLKSTYDVDGGGIKLGQGAYGSVTAVRRKIDGEQFALKMVKIGGDSDATFEEIRNEVAIQKRLDHPNIAKIYESYEDVPNKMMCAARWTESDGLRHRGSPRISRRLPRSPLISALAPPLRPPQVHRDGVLHGRHARVAHEEAPARLRREGEEG